MHKKVSSLRARVLLLVAMPFALMLGLTAYHTLTEREERLANARARVLDTARVMAGEQRRIVEHVHQVLAELALLPEVRSGIASEECNRALAARQQREPTVLNILLARADGDVICHAIQPAGRISIADRDFFKAALRTRDFSVGGYVISRTTGRPGLGFALPLLDDTGTPQTVIATTLSLGWLKQELARAQLPEGTRVALVDGEGIFVAHYPDTEEWIGKSAAQLPPLKSILAKGGEGTREDIGLDGQRRIFGFVPLQRTVSGQAYLWVAVPKDLVAGPAEHAFVVGVLSELALLALVFWAVWVGNQSLFVRRIVALSRAAKELGKGNLAARVGAIADGDEIGQLAQSFDRMAEGLQTRETQLSQAVRALKVLSAGNRAMLHSKHGEQLLLEHMCNAIGETGGYRMAWVGYAENDMEKSVRPMAHWGSGAKAYFDNVKHTWSEAESGRAPPGRAIRTEMPAVAQDIQREPGPRPWQEHALRSGCGSCLALPLRVDERVIGVLGICAEEIDAFSDEEVSLLSEAAADLSFGIARQRAEAEQARMKDALKTAEERVAAAAEASLDALFILKSARDTAGRIVDFEFGHINAHAEEMLGIGREKVIGQKLCELLPFNRTSGLFDKYVQVATTGAPLEEELPVDAPEIRAKWLRQQVVRVDDGVAVSSRDITEWKEAGAAFRDLARNNALILSSAGEGIYGLDREGRITFINPAAAAMLGWKAEELIGQDSHATFHYSKVDGTPYPKEECPAHAAYRDGATYRVTDDVLWKKDGTGFPVEYVSTPIRDEDGESRGAVVAFNDITERKRAEQTLREREETLRTISSAAQDAVLMLDSDGNIAFWNPAAETIFGYSRQEAMGQELHALLAPLRFREACQRGFAKFKGTGEGPAIGKTIELAALRKDGIEFPMELSLSAVKLKDKWHAVGIVRDITQRKKTEEQLRESEARHRSLVAAMAEGVVLQDANGAIVMFNESAERILGLSSGQLLGRDSIDPRWHAIHEDGSAFPGESHPSMVTLRTGVPQSNVVMGVHKPDGVLSWISINTQPILSPGKLLPDGVVSSFREITEMKAAQEKLRLANAVVENSPAVLFRWRAAEGWPVEYVSSNVRQFGYSAEELLTGAVPYARMVYPEDTERVAAEVARYTAGGSERFAQEYRVVTRDGAVRWVDDRTNIERDAKGEVLYYQGVLTDITEKKQAEEARRAAALYTRSLIEASLDPLVTISPDGKITDVSKATEDVTGVPRGRLIGTDFADYFTEPDKARAGYQQVLAEGYVRDYPLTIRHSAGRTTDVLYNATVYRNEAGELQGVFAAARDITERKRTERQLTLVNFAMNHVREAALLVDEHGRMLYVNDDACQTLGYSREELLKLGIPDIDPDFPLERWPDHWRELKARKSLTFEGRHRAKDGRIFPVEISANYLEYEDCGYNLGLVRDISERKRAEEARRAAALYTRSLIEASLDPLVTISPDGKITDVSKATEDVTGVPRGRLIGTDFADYFTEPGKARAGYEQVLAEGYVRDYPLTIRHNSGRTTDVLYNATVFRNEAGELQGVFAAARDITERKRAADAIEKSERRFHQTLDEMMEGCSLFGFDWTCLYMNDAAARNSHQERKNVIGRTIMESYPGIEQTEVFAGYRRAMKERAPQRFEASYTFPDGSSGWYEFSVEPAPEGIFVLSLDITARKQDELALERANRALRTLSACNEALVRAGTEAELLDSICRLVVETGGYRMAWVGFAEQDPAKTVRPVAQYGDEEGYLVVTKFSWADTELGRGPTGTAIRAGSVQVNRNFLTDPALAPWREAAQKRGYQSSVALPLKSSAGMLGALTIDAPDPDAFNEAEVRLLRELADDLAFGIDTLRTRAERDRNAHEHLHHEEILRTSLEESIKAIANTVEMRDPYTAGHQRRVGELAVAISRELGLPEETVHGIQLASGIHDLGKIRVPAEILSKPGKLTDIELMLVQAHAQAGYDILKGVTFPWPIATMVLQHHERQDGSGYPQGLKGEQIRLESRIIAVADVVEAMASHRPYRAGLGIDAALAEIERGAGSVYDEAVAAACVKLLRDGRFAFPG